MSPAAISTSREALGRPTRSARPVAKAYSSETDVSAGRPGPKNLVAQTFAPYGGVDVLFSNVGVVIGNAIADVSEQEWDQVMNVNLKSMFLAMQICPPRNAKTRAKGSIVLTSSANGILAEPCLATYCATKAAIIGMITKYRDGLRQRQYPGELRMPDLHSHPAGPEVDRFGR